MSDRNTLKAYFNLGDEPTEAQLADMIDSELNLDDDSQGFTGSVKITNQDHSLYGETIENTGGNIVDFLKKIFIPFDPATVSINGGTTYIELGVSTNVSISGVVYKNSETVFNNERIYSPSDDTVIHTFIVGAGDEQPYSYIDNGITNSKSYKTIIGVDNNGTPGEIESSLKSIVAVVPFLHGSNVTELLDSTIYTNPNMNKEVEPKGIKSVTYDANEEYLHFAFPSSWGLPSRITDNNGYIQTFGASGSGEDWEYVTRTIVTPNWTENLYIFTQGPTTVQGDFTFNF